MFHTLIPVRHHREKIGTGRIDVRSDQELIKRVREARIKLGSELVRINGVPRFIDPAEIVPVQQELAA